ncbi:MAG TPA: hypothetical protein VMU54_18685, partial [Planctomycetota bacterium]|nr:hypothetical protein [Planctomycetota bacterium]
MMRFSSALAALALMGLTAAPFALPQSAPPPASPSGGAYGVTLTIAELLDRQRNAPPPVQGQSPRRHTRPGTQSAQKRQTSSPSKPAAAVSGKIPQTVGTTFQGDSADISVIYPPDCGGAVGPTQFVVATNHVVAAYNKQTSALNFSIATSVFFSAVLRTGLDAVDPRVRFDRLSQRWVLTSIEASLTTNNVNNRVMIAVSNGPQLTSGSSFTFFFFEEDLASPAGDSGAFADYDTLGVDANALYIGVNIFGATTFNTTAFVVQKSSVLGAGPMNVTAFRGLVAASGSGIFTPQGVNNDDPAATEGYFIGPDAATTASITGSVSTLIVKRITNPGSTTPTISGDLTVSIPTATFFSEGVFTTGGNIVDDLDLRLFMATIKNVGGVPALWATHNIQYNNGSNDAVAWYKIGSLTTTPTLLDNGSILGTNPTESCWMPSLAVSGQGHMVVAYN